MLFLAQFVRLVEQFIESEKIRLNHDLSHQDDSKRKVLILINRIKSEFLNEWVTAVNNHGGFGKQHWNVSFHPSDMERYKKWLE